MDQFPFGEPRDLDRLQRYAEASRPQSLVVTGRGVTRTEEEDVTLGRVDVAIEIARSTESLICAVVAARPILDAMRAQGLDLGSPPLAVRQLASTLAQQPGWARAVFAFPPSAELVPALDILDRADRPLLRVGRPIRRAEPDVVVRVRRRLVPGRSRRKSR